MRERVSLFGQGTGFRKWPTDGTSLRNAVVGSTRRSPPASLSLKEVTISAETTEMFRLFIVVLTASSRKQPSDSAGMFDYNFRPARLL